MGFLISLEDSVGAFFHDAGSVFFLVSFIGCVLTIERESRDDLFVFLLFSGVDFDFTLFQPSSFIRLGCTHIISPDVVVAEISLSLLSTLLISRNSTVFDLTGPMLIGSNDPNGTMLTDAISYF